jgi:hypothetical protein
MSKQIVKPLELYEIKKFDESKIEDSYKIDQRQLDNTKVYTSREEYSKQLKNGIKYLEIGVAWGYSVDLVAKNAKPSSMDLLDWYNQDLKCWSWRKFGSCQCEGMKHELLYTPETHEAYIIDKFKNYSNVQTIKGDALKLLPNIKNKYDYIYIDITNERNITRKVLSYCKDLVDVDGIIGLNDYLIYDGIIENSAYGTFQTVNEFLYLNKNWSVDAIALHNLGFYDIYLKKDEE